MAISQRRTRRHRKIRKRIRGTAMTPRLSVFRSNRWVALQLIDDDSSRTILGFTDRRLPAGELPQVPTEFDSVRLQRAYRAGFILGREAKSKGIGAAVFDRGGYRYHGRVRAVAQGARAAGLHL